MRNLTLAILLIFLDFRYSLIGFRLKRAGTSCMTPSGESGNCIKITDCKPAFDLLVNNKNDSKIREQIKSLKCGYEENQPKVCCKLESLRDDGPTELPDSSSNKFPEDCGRSDVPTFNRLFGARPARLGAWPWMALIAYYQDKPVKDTLTLVDFIKDEQDSKVLKYHCSGSLISDRLVVTVATCLDTTLLENSPVVRLGELDYSTKIDGANPIDVPIEAVIKHKCFDTIESPRNNIGVIRLKRPVSFTSHIKPICLPTSEVWKTKSYVGAHPHLIGWGVNTDEIEPEIFSFVASTIERNKSSLISKHSARKRSAHLLEVQIEIIATEDCQKAFPGTEIDDGIICTGGGKIKPCKGDAGAPLMIKEDGRFYLYGIVSFGDHYCDSLLPSGNTNVVNYIDWLKRNAFDETLSEFTKL